MNVLLKLCLGGCFAAAAIGQQFYAVDVAPVGRGEDRNDLVLIDFETAQCTTIGTISVAGITPLLNISGLAWSSGFGKGQLIASRAAFGYVYHIDPATAEATLIGASPRTLHDLAYNPQNSRIYGLDGYGLLFKDDDGDHVPETYVGKFRFPLPSLTDRPVTFGLAFDLDGNVFVSDATTSAIYKGNGDDPTSIEPFTNISGLTASLGLYIGTDGGFFTGYRDPQLKVYNYSFDPTDAVSFTLESVFPVNFESTISQYQIADLTVLPAVPVATTNAEQSVLTKQQPVTANESQAKPIRFDFNGLGGGQRCPIAEQSLFDQRFSTADRLPLAGKTAADASLDFKMLPRGSFPMWPLNVTNPVLIRRNADQIPQPN